MKIFLKNDWVDHVSDASFKKFIKMIVKASKSEMKPNGILYTIPQEEIKFKKNGVMK